MQESEYYDEVYFDSDQESTEQGTAGIGLIKSKSKVLSNDELLYDPDLDDKDEEWVAKQIDKDSFRTEQDVPIDSKTDAILSCPMCFTNLCYSCQRHDMYADQFRAMFVHNCHTVPGERYKIKNDQGKEEHFYKITCETCGVHVAMLDQEEIYHFFNVIATTR